MLKVSKCKRSLILLGKITVGVALLLTARVPHTLAASSATIVVNSSQDTESAGDGACTLREAMNNANVVADLSEGDCAAGSGTGDVIGFAIPGSGPQTISLQDGLPTIQVPLTIDATTQPGYVANTAVSPNPYNGVQVIEIDGSGIAGGNQRCILAYGISDVALKGLTVNSCRGDGIRLEHVNNVSITGSYIGVDTSGMINKPNGGLDQTYYGGSGIYEESVNHATIGGVQAADRNVISGNQYGEIFIQSQYVGSNPSDPFDNSYNTVQGNYLGLGADGLTAMPCGFAYGTGNSILIDHSGHDLIGGTDLGAKNVIASSREFGISFRNGSANSAVQGNYIGTDYTGAKAATHQYGSGNISSGVSVAAVSNGGYRIASHDIQIGGTTESARNVISGNHEVAGSRFQAGGITIHDGAYGVTVQGNYLGTDVSGTKAVPNSSTGVGVSSPNNTIGGSTPAAGNLISGNSQGVGIFNTTNVSLQNNLIGTDITGTKALGNQGEGVVIGNSSSIAVSDNTVSANARGIALNGTNNVTIQANRAGTDVTGTKALGNSDAGVSATGSSNHILSNTVSANGQGINLYNSSNTEVRGNNVGTDITGTKALGNTGPGLNVTGSSNSITDNTVSANGQGISLGNANKNIVQNNRVGVDTQVSKLLGNTDVGIIISNGSGNTIGGSTANLGNTIGGNGQGIYLQNATNTTVQANNIGTDITGTKNFANAAGMIVEGSSNNLVGCRVNPCRNLIANNTQVGLVMLGNEAAPSTNNKVTGNTIRNNGNSGIALLGTVASNQIGGTTAPDYNYIAANNGPGVAVIELQATAAYPTNNSILGNRFDANTGGSIDHMADADGDYNPELFAGSTPNNTSGTNDLQNYPTISNASFSGGNVTFTYSFSPRSGVAAPNGYRLEFYGGADATNGRFMLGSVNVSGAVTNQTVTMPLKNGLNLKYLMGSATGMLSPITYGSTSEFTPGLLITGMPANY